MRHVNLQLQKLLTPALAGMVFAALYAPAAMAGVGLGCAALDGSKAEVHIALGGGVGFSALSADATDGKTAFSDKKEKGKTRFMVAQGMQLGDAYYVDFADDNLERIIVSLRVNVDLLAGFTYPKSDGDIMFGTLIFAGQKPVPVACELG